MRSFLLAFQFLTILPFGRGVAVCDEEIARSSGYFVIVGLVQGIALVGADYVAGMVFHPDLVTALVLLVLVLSNGGFHLDGLADTFDALAVKSTGDEETDRQKRLTIMKGSTSGPIGVTAIIFGLGLEYLALKNISNLSFFQYYAVLLLLPVFPKWVMVVSMFHGKPARKDGLGSIFVAGTGTRELAFSTSLLVLQLVLVRFLFVRFVPDGYEIFCAVLMGLLYVFALWWNRFLDRKTGGLTGDSVGALGEVSEILFLFMVILWSRLSI